MLSELISSFKPSLNSFKLGLNKVTPLYELKLRFLGSTQVGMPLLLASSTTLVISFGVIKPLL